MNLLRDAPPWAQVLLMLLLVAAAAQDVAQRRISNLFCIAVIAAAAVAAIATGPTPALWQNGLLFVLLIGLSLPLFAAGWLGGGDVKLLAALGLWADLVSILPLLAVIFLSGGGVALISLAVRTKPLNRSTKGVPYGVAIALGAGVLLAQPILFRPVAERPSPLDLHAARAGALHP